MLALCFMLLETYYAQRNASIMCLSLFIIRCLLSLTSDVGKELIIYNVRLSSKNSLEPQYLWYLARQPIRMIKGICRIFVWSCQDLFRLRGLSGLVASSWLGSPVSLQDCSSLSRSACFLIGNNIEVMSVPVLLSSGCVDNIGPWQSSWSNHSSFCRPVLGCDPHVNVVRYWWEISGSVSLVEVDPMLLLELFVLFLERRSIRWAVCLSVSLPVWGIGVLTFLPILSFAGNEVTPWQGCLPVTQECHFDFTSPSLRCTQLDHYFLDCLSHDQTRKPSKFLCCKLWSVVVTANLFRDSMPGEYNFEAVNHRCWNFQQSNFWISQEVAVNR